MTASTSFRISAAARSLLARTAAHEGVTSTSLLEQLIVEGISARDHPGITFRGPVHDRRAALAAGPDVWEVVSRLRELEGAEEQRIAALCAESELAPREVRIALDFAASDPAAISRRIERNRTQAEAGAEATRRRQALLA